MDYVTYQGGRFGNQLYYILQSFIKNKIYILTEREINKQYYNQLIQIFNKLNFNKYFICDNVNINSNKYRISSYCQNINTDYNYTDIKKFCCNTFFISQFFLSNYKRNLEDLCIHIRNTDYLKIPGFIFNFEEYLKKSLDKFRDFNIKKIYVYSDDIEYTMKKYNDIIKELNDNIIYVSNKEYIDDFIEMCGFKYKIIWNSTFSIWSSYISNIMINKSYIISPQKFFKNITMKTKCLENWIII